VKSSKIAILTRRTPKVALAIAALGGLLALLGALITGPSRAPYDMDDCQRAYRRAHTYQDTLAVDAHPFPGRQRDTTRHCGVLRGRP
jgi:hypothetical protein